MGSESGSSSRAQSAFLNGLLLSLLHQEPETEPVMCARRMGTEIDGAAEIPLRGIPIPIEVQADQSHRQMRVGKGWPHLDGFRRRGFRLRKRLLAGSTPNTAKEV